jgi:hypothetical protein
LMARGANPRSGRGVRRERSFSSLVGSPPLVRGRPPETHAKTQTITRGVHKGCAVAVRLVCVLWVRVYTLPVCMHAPAVPHSDVPSQLLSAFDKCGSDWCPPTEFNLAILDWCASKSSLWVRTQQVHRTFVRVKASQGRRSCGVRGVRGASPLPSPTPYRGGVLVCVPTRPSRETVGVWTSIRVRRGPPFRGGSLRPLLDNPVL